MHLKILLFWKIVFGISFNGGLFWEATSNYHIHYMIFDDSPFWWSIKAYKFTAVFSFLWKVVIEDYFIKWITTRLYLNRPFALNWRILSIKFSHLKVSVCRTKPLRGYQILAKNQSSREGLEWDREGLRVEGDPEISPGMGLDFIFLGWISANIWCVHPFKKFDLYYRKMIKTVLYWAHLILQRAILNWYVRHILYYSLFFDSFLINSTW